MRAGENDQSRDARAKLDVTEGDVDCSAEKAKRILSTCVQRELRTCARVGELYPKNYYAWSYRGGLIAHLEDDTVRYCSPPRKVATAGARMQANSIQAW